MSAWPRTRRDRRQRHPRRHGRDPEAVAEPLRAGLRPSILAMRMTATTLRCAVARENFHSGSPMRRGDASREVVDHLEIARRRTRVNAT